MQIRCYGGSLDGQLVKTADPPRDRMVQHTAPDRRYVPGLNRWDLVEMNEEVYWLHFLTGSSQKFPVYMISGWSGDDLIRRLLR